MPPASHFGLPVKARNRPKNLQIRKVLNLHLILGRMTRKNLVRKKVKLNQILAVAANGRKLLMFGLTAGCNKPEGAGGDLTPIGQVLARKYNPGLTNLISEYPLPEERVYFIYGNNEIYSEDFIADYQGRYWFEILQPGKKRVIAYTRESSGKEPSGLMPVFVQVKLDAGKPVSEVPQLILAK